MHQRPHRDFLSVQNAAGDTVYTLFKLKHEGGAHAVYVPHHPVAGGGAGAAKQAQQQAQNLAFELAVKSGFLGESKVPVALKISKEALFEQQKLNADGSQFRLVAELLSPCNSEFEETRQPPPPPPLAQPPTVPLVPPVPKAPGGIIRPKIEPASCVSASSAPRKISDAGPVVHVPRAFVPEYLSIGKAPAEGLDSSVLRSFGSMLLEDQLARFFPLTTDSSWFPRAHPELPGFPSVLRWQNPADAPAQVDLSADARQIIPSLTSLLVPRSPVVTPQASIEPEPMIELAPPSLHPIPVIVHPETKEVNKAAVGHGEVSAPPEDNTKETHARRWRHQFASKFGNTTHDDSETEASVSRSRGPKWGSWIGHYDLLEPAGHHHHQQSPSSSPSVESPDRESVSRGEEEIQSPTLSPSSLHGAPKHSPSHRDGGHHHSENRSSSSHHHHAQDGGHYSENRSSSSSSSSGNHHHHSSSASQGDGHRHSENNHHSENTARSSGASSSSPDHQNHHPAPEHSASRRSHHSENHCESNLPPSGQHQHPPRSSVAAHREHSSSSSSHHSPPQSGETHKDHDSENNRTPSSSHHRDAPSHSESRQSGHHSQTRPQSSSHHGAPSHSESHHGSHHKDAPSHSESRHSGHHQDAPSHSESHYGSHHKDAPSHSESRHSGHHQDAPSHSDSHHGSHHKDAPSHSESRHSGHHSESRPRSSSHHEPPLSHSESRQRSSSSHHEAPLSHSESRRSGHHHAVPRSPSVSPSYHRHHAAAAGAGGTSGSRASSLSPPSHHAPVAHSRSHSSRHPPLSHSASQRKNPEDADPAYSDCSRSSSRLAKHHSSSLSSERNLQLQHPGGHKQHSGRVLSSDSELPHSPMHHANSVNVPPSHRALPGQLPKEIIIAMRSSSRLRTSSFSGNRPRAGSSPTSKSALVSKVDLGALPPIPRRPRGLSGGDPMSLFLPTPTSGSRRDSNASVGSAVLIPTTPGSRRESNASGASALIPTTPGSRRESNAGGASALIPTTPGSRRESNAVVGPAMPTPTLGSRRESNASGGSALIPTTPGSRRESNAGVGSSGVLVPSSTEARRGSTATCVVSSTFLPAPCAAASQGQGRRGSNASVSSTRRESAGNNADTPTARQQREVGFESVAKIEEPPGPRFSFGGQVCVAQVEEYCQSLQAEAGRHTASESAAGLDGCGLDVEVKLKSWLWFDIPSKRRSHHRAVTRFVLQNLDRNGSSARDPYDPHEFMGALNSAVGSQLPVQREKLLGLISSCKWPKSDKIRVTATPDSPSAEISESSLLDFVDVMIENRVAILRVQNLTALSEGLQEEAYEVHSLLLKIPGYSERLLHEEIVRAGFYLDSHEFGEDVPLITRHNEKQMLSLTDVRALDDWRRTYREGVREVVAKLRNWVEGNVADTAATRRLHHPTKIAAIQMLRRYFLGRALSDCSLIVNIRDKCDASFTGEESRWVFQDPELMSTFKYRAMLAAEDAPESEEPAREGFMYRISLIDLDLKPFEKLQQWRDQYKELALKWGALEAQN